MALHFSADGSVRTARTSMAKALWLWVAFAWVALLTAYTFPRPIDLLLGLVAFGWKYGVGEGLPLAFFLLLALATGSALFGKLTPADGPKLDVFLAHLGLGLGTMACASLALALVGLLNYAALAALAAVWIALIIRPVGESLRETLRIGRAFASETRNLRHPFSLLAAFVFLTFATIGLVGALAPEIEFDALWYHLYLPRLYAQLGQLVDVPEEFVSQYPLNVEMLYALGLMFRGEILAKLINYAFGILDALIAYRLARSVASRRASLLAAAITVSTPTFLWEMTTAANELGLTFFIGLSLLALVNWTSCRTWRWLVVSALAMGLALGSKHLALFALGGSAVWIIAQGYSTKEVMPVPGASRRAAVRPSSGARRFRLWLRHSVTEMASRQAAHLGSLQRLRSGTTATRALVGAARSRAAAALPLVQAQTRLSPVFGFLDHLGSFARGWARRRLRLPSLSPLIVGALYSGLAIAIASPWYVKSWIITGNPVFPFFARFFPTSEWRWNEGLQRTMDLYMSQFGPGRDLPSTLGVLWDLTAQPWNYYGELGLVFLGLAPFALLAARKGPRPVLCLIWFCASYTALWASPASSLQMRFLVPIVPALSALVAISVDWLSRSGLPRAGRAGRLSLQIWVLVLLLANLPWLNDFRGPRQQPWDNYVNQILHNVPFGVVLGAETTRDYLSHSVEGYEAIQYVNRTVAPDARILDFFGGLNYHSARKIVVHYSPSVPNEIYTQDPPDDAALAGRLRAAGFTHVLFAKRMWRTDAKDYAIVRQSFFDSHLVYKWQDDEALLYELRLAP